MEPSNLKQSPCAAIENFWNRHTQNFPRSTVYHRRRNPVDDRVLNQFRCSELKEQDGRVVAYVGYSYMTDKNWEASSFVAIDPQTISETDSVDGKVLNFNEKGEYFEAIPTTIGKLYHAIFQPK